MNTLDDLRRHYPMFGFALYALDPNEHMTLDVLFLDQSTVSFRGWTEAEVVGKVAATFGALTPTPIEPPTEDIFS